MKWYALIGTLSTVIVTAVAVVLTIQEPTRMAEFTEANQARQIEDGATLFESHCSTCHGPEGKGIDNFAPAINARDLFDGTRMQDIGFTGTVEDYVRSTISAGRPKPTAGTNFPRRMPTWSQRFGGPLRDDQIESLVVFVMNWKERALAEPAQPPIEGVGTNINVELPEGDPDRGHDLTVTFGCPACHISSDVGPAWMAQGDQPGIATRAETRLHEEGYQGNATTGEQYLVESILLPNAYVIQGYQAGTMPVNFGDRMTVQDLADIVAYLLTLK